MKKIISIFKWSWKDLLAAVAGCLLSALGLNLFIIPNALYSGGVMGISQLIRTFINYLGFHPGFDLAGIIYFLINLPLLLLARKALSKTFFARTLLCIICETMFLSIIPIPSHMLVNEVFTSVLMGGVISGIGGGIVFSTQSSSGGTDIIGFMLSMKSHRFSVGRFNVAVNLFIYAICGCLYGLSTMIYSITYSVISSTVIDHTHKQNVCSYVIIFMKNDPKKLIQFIIKELNRDATYWDAIGGYKNETTHVVYSVLSKYEVERLERHLHEFDQNAFMIKSEGIGIDGNFKKYLIE